MLTHIHIKNFMLVKDLNLDFTTGFSILTGETGAGKSLWIDAISMALGQRADSSIIRTNEERCDITVCFALSDNVLARDWLNEQDIQYENECIVRRIIARNSNSRITINGVPCTAQQVRQLSDLLLSIYGQHQHHALLTREMQRMCLDQYGDHADLVTQIQNNYQEWKKLNAQLNALELQSKNRDAELNLLRYQHQEIVDLQLGDNEWQELSQKHQTLHHAEQDQMHLNNALNLMIENDRNSSYQLLQESVRHLNQIQLKNSQLDSAKELFNSALVNIQEGIDDLHRCQKNLDANPESLQHIEQRLTQIHQLARKHHVNPEELKNVETKLANNIFALENMEQQRAEILQHIHSITSDYQILADKLTQQRKKAAKSLDGQMTKNMQLLGMQGGSFRVHFERQPEMTAYGNEQIIFEVITNAGHDFQPLHKIVSGGELSRIGLALQVITAQKFSTPTLIFDEVDVGVGGKTAAIIGQMLRELGQQNQVLCITHLPQVAAYGHHQYRAFKHALDGTSITQIELLDEQQRIEELARMLGGANITQQTLAHAKEMLEV